MHTAFISSVQRDYGGMREVAARGAEAYGLRVLMAERTAAGWSARSALLDLVRQSDVFLLLLGAHYGDAAPGETSPTEEEFNAQRSQRVLAGSRLRPGANLYSLLPMVR
jgi:hypothetical protein